MFPTYYLFAISLKQVGFWQQYLHYRRSLLKRGNCNCYIQFVENYRSADVIRKFLKFRIPNNGCFEPTAVHNFQRKLLREELFKAKKALAEQESKVCDERNILKSVLP